MIAGGLPLGKTIFKPASNTSPRGQVLLLAGAQVLFQTASVLAMTVGGLAGAQIASSPEFATMPIAAMFLGTAAMTFPASLLMARAGRRVGFRSGRPPRRPGRAHRCCWHLDRLAPLPVGGYVPLLVPTRLSRSSTALRPARLPRKRSGQRRSRLCWPAASSRRQAVRCLVASAARSSNPPM